MHEGTFQGTERLLEDTVTCLTLGHDTFLLNQHPPIRNEQVNVINKPMHE